MHHRQAQSSGAVPGRSEKAPKVTGNLETKQTRSTFQFYFALAPRRRRTSWRIFDVHFLRELQRRSKRAKLAPIEAQMNAPPRKRQSIEVWNSYVVFPAEGVWKSPRSSWNSPTPSDPREACQSLPLLLLFPLRNGPAGS